MLETFASKLLKLRTELGLTQVGMADVLGIGEKMYYKYEKGKFTGTAKRQETYLEKIETYRISKLKNSEALSEPENNYKVTVHDPPERIDPTEAILLLATSNSKLVETNSQQQKMIQNLLKRIDQLQKKWDAEHMSSAPKQVAEVPSR